MGSEMCIRDRVYVAWMTGFKGLQAQEKVSDAIGKLLNGERSWDPDKYTLVQHLTFICKSEYRHLIKKSQKQVSLETKFPDGLPTNQSPDLFYELEQELDSVKKAIVESNDKVALYIVHAYETQGFESHQNVELAAHIGYSLHDIENAKKRIKRILKKLKEKNRLEEDKDV